MITWLTAMSLFDSAESLQTPQLLRAQIESESLFFELTYGESMEEIGLAPVPLRLMWEGFEIALAGYSIACCAVAVGRGVNLSPSAMNIAASVRDLRETGDEAPLEIPAWLSDTDLLSSHRSNLMRRWPTRYNWKRIPNDMPYLWPTNDGDGNYSLRLSKYDKGLLASGERKLDKRIMEKISNV